MDVECAVCQNIFTPDKKCNGLAGICKKFRQKKSYNQPKCKGCGNVLSLDRVSAEYKTCTRCDAKERIDEMYNTSAAYLWLNDDNSIDLDGDFTIGQLEQVINIMKEI